MIAGDASYGLAEENIQEFFDVLPMASEDGQLLRLPKEVGWRGRKSQFGSTMLVRRSYLDVLNIIHERLRRRRVKSFIITGTPGIGKSFFAFYCLYKRVKEGKAVIFEVNEACYIWRPGEKVIEAKREHIEKLMGKAELLYLVDSRKDIHTIPDCTTIMFSSPRDSNFHDFHKHGAEIFYLPLWSTDELEAARKGIYEAKGVSAARMRAIRLVHGPIPRYTLYYASRYEWFGDWSEEDAQRGNVVLTERDWLRLAIDKADVRSLPRIGPFETERNRGDYSFRLLHLDTENYTETTQSWASDFVFRKLVEKNKRLILSLARKLVFASGEVRELGALAGTTFEEIIHWVLRNGCKHFSVRSLSNKDEAQCHEDRGPSFPKTRSSVLHFTNLRAVGKPLQGVYYRPLNRNQSSADSFMIFQQDLSIFQTTISARHPVKAKGLQDIIRFANVEGKVFLIFVVPQKNYKGFSKQKYHGEDRKVKEDAFSECRVEQWVLSIDDETFDDLERSIGEYCWEKS